jgi:two-component system, OmpR family, sensor histidine kinase QseC
MGQTRTTGSGTASLRARLLIALLSLIGVVWIVVIALTYVDAQRELDTVLDSHLIQSARLLVAQSAHELEELDFEEPESPGPYDQNVAFQIWRGGRNLVLKSADAPSTRLSPTDSGLSETDIAGTHWRVYSQWDQHRRMLVQVAEDRAVRDKLAARIAFNTTVPMLLTVPLLVIAIGWAIQRALRPVLLLGREVERRRPLALEPMTASGIPREIVPLVDKLNALFAGVRQAFEQERRFTANAAHELRTPLSALRVQAEVARDAHNPATTRAALDQVIVACDRLTRLISQLLTLARADEQATEHSRCRLDSIAREVIADYAPQALAANQDISLEASEPIEMEGNVSLLAAMLRNLVDNALRHGGSPLHVTVSLAHSGDEILVTVNDDGRGVPPDALQTLSTRFFRPSGTLATGSGLGLALARRIAEWHGGTLVLSAGSGGRGLQARITLRKDTDAR